MPKVSVLIPVYMRLGRSALLEESLRSIVAQTLSDIEILIGFDGVAGRIGVADPRIRTYLYPHRGLFSTFNSLLSEARGRYVSMFSDDDKMEPTFLEKSAAALDHSDYTFSRTDFFYWYMDGRPPERSSVEFHYAMLFRKETLDRVAQRWGAMFPPELRQYGDAVLLARLRQMGASVCHVEEPLVWFRTHPQQITRQVHFRTILDHVHAMNLIGSASLKYTMKQFGWWADNLTGRRVGRIRRQLSPPRHGPGV